jgi:hypothetical protein
VILYFEECLMSKAAIIVVELSVLCSRAQRTSNHALLFL